MEKVFKFNDKLCHYEVSVREEEVYPRLLEKHQELVSQDVLSPSQRVEEFLHLLILVRINFRYNIVYGTSI